MAEDRIYRTLVRIVEVNKTGFTVVIPGWDGQMRIPINRNSVPERVWIAVHAGMRMHVRVNLGAYRMEDLTFQDWELDHDISHAHLA